MIKIGNRDITLKLGSTNVSAAYLGSVQVYGNSSYDLCYGVTDDISTYTGTFKDVFDKSSDTWYKLNNLNEYEEYGVYGNGRNITTYEGKLTIDGDYEYQYTNGAWVNVGEVSGNTRVPSGYTELTYAQTSKVITNSGNTFWIENDLEYDYKYTFEFTPLNWEDNYYGTPIGGNDNDPKFFYYGIFKLDNGWGDMTKRFVAGLHGYNVGSRGGYGGNYRVYTDVRSKFEMHLHNYNISEGVDITVYNEGYDTFTHTSTTKTGQTTNGVYDMPIFTQSINNGSVYTPALKFHDFKVETSGGSIVYDYVPVKRNSDNKVGLYDIVNDRVYIPSAITLTAGEEATHITYPIYYDEKSDPLDNLTFNSLADAEAYAYANCVYDGMKATIDGERYVFDSENGWTVVPEYYIVTDVTPQGASGWTITGSSTYNPDSSYYDDFSVVNANSSNVTKIAKVTIYGYNHFTYYLRSYGYSSYAYVYATNVDELSSDPTTNFGYNSSSAITNTFQWNKNQGSAVNLSNYRRVTYNNLDKTVEHTFYIVFYGRTYSSYQANATILIPKDQSQENWEQVTFSASTNIASTQKNLYIDGNNSTSGGSNAFCYRWMVGLPSGTHTGYTNYSYYNYCPNVTSVTFTSVAGNSRQVNFTYNDTTNKNLSVRLTDGSGNTLSPSDTVYYNMTFYNSCGVSSSSSNVTFPRNITGKVGGSFSFSNSSNRHYIYGYQPPTLGTRYYVDNYQSTFDIVYTKLSEEAVTITFTTYDPNDSETPSFNTDITYPYNGGKTSATTLTSFDVPYTYPYTVEETNNLFSADTYTYTAGQASRAISFTLYPNNREFATVADMEAYQYAWEGMKAFVGDTKYKYEDGQWVELTYSLPDVPFMVNYNAKNYDAQNYTLKKTEGQSRDVDAVCSYGYGIVDHSSDGYITITADTRMNITGTPYFNRSNDATGCTMTIVSKVRTTNGYSILTNRGGTSNQMNWMWRYPSNGIFLHGSSTYSTPKYNVSTTSQPIVASVRTYYDNGVKQKLRDHTNNGSYDGLFSYGNTYEGNSSLFVDYNTHNSEFWRGDFYWVYMTFSVLTDEQILEVIDYNENL